MYLIDEVTTVPGWPAIIKAARDDTAFATDMVDWLAPDVTPGDAPYARTSTAEIDFAPTPIRAGGTMLKTAPVEAKWVTQGWRSGAQAIEHDCGPGFIATKNILDTSHQIMGRAGLLALVLSWRA